jgi:hypothetical protein
LLKLNRYRQLHGVLLLPLASGLCPCLHPVKSLQFLPTSLLCRCEEFRTLGLQSLRRSLLALELSSRQRGDPFQLNLIEPREPLDLASLRLGRVEPAHDRTTAAGQLCPGASSAVSTPPCVVS